MSWLQHTIGSIDPYVVAYGAAAVFVVIYFESLGAPLPGETVLIAASLFAVRGDLHIVNVALAGWAGAVMGDSTGYLIGRYGGRPLLQRFGPLLKLTPELLARFEKMFAEKGAYLVLTARFVVVLRQLNGLIAGTMAMPWPRFFAANAAGAVLWIATWALGPYFFTDLFVRH